MPISYTYRIFILKQEELFLPPHRAAMRLIFKRLLFMRSLIPLQESLHPIGLLQTMERDYAKLGLLATFSDD
jgi:hypothetical protein